MNRRHLSLPLFLFLLLLLQLSSCVGAPGRAHDDAWPDEDPGLGVDRAPNSRAEPEWMDRRTRAETTTSSAVKKKDEEGKEGKGKEVGKDGNGDEPQKSPR